MIRIGWVICAASVEFSLCVAIDELNAAFAASKDFPKEPLLAETELAQLYLLSRAWWYTWMWCAEPKMPFIIGMPVPAYFAIGLFPMAGIS